MEYLVISKILVTIIKKQFYGDICIYNGRLFFPDVNIFGHASTQPHRVAIRNAYMLYICNVQVVEKLDVSALV